MRAIGIGIGTPFMRRIGAGAPPAARIDFTGDPVAENVAAGAVLGALQVFNATGTPAYTLTDHDGNRVALSGANVVRGATALDYETHPVVTFSVSVSGMTPAPSAATFTVTVTDVAEGGGDLALDLDFTTGMLDPRVTFTRAGPASYYGSDGLLKTAATNVARFDHDPATLQPRGLLLEEQRTNLLLQSADFSHAAWTSYAAGGNTISVTPNAAAAPDGTMTADLIATNVVDAANWAFLSQPTTMGTGPVFFTIWLKAKDAGSVGRTVEFVNWRGIMDSPADFVLTANWKRYEAYISNGFEANPAFAHIATRPQTGVVEFYAWGAQLEAGACATSYIPTTTAAVTRAADSANFNDISWLNQATGTVVQEVSQLAVTANNAAWFYAEGPGTKIAFNVSNSPENVWVYITGSAAFIGHIGNYQANMPFKAAVAWADNDAAAVKDGGTVLTGSAGTPPSNINAVALGATWFGYRMNGHFRRLVHYNTRKSNAELQALTALPAIPPALDLDFTTGVLDPRVTFTRAGPAMMYDATGKLTTAPNNQVGFSNEFTQASWAKENVSITTGITDPDGGTSASTMTVTGGTTHTNRRIYWGNPIGAGTTNKYVYSVWIRRRSGTGAIYISGGAGYTDITSQVSGTWARVFSAAAPLYHLVALAGAPGEAVDIWRTQADHVTYEITPRTYIPTTTSAAVYGPRFDHDPTTLAPRGLLLEEQRTNSALRSAELNNAAWVTSGTLSVTADATVAPDGTTTADLLTAITPAGAFMFQTVTLAGVAVSSVYVKKGTADWVYLKPQGGDQYFAYFNINTGVVGTIAGAAIAVSITNAGNGWWRITAGRTTLTYCVFGICDANSSPTVTAGKTAYFWGAQAEVGSSATSYIPTTTAAVTRAADSAVMTGTNFSSWYVNGPGTVIAAADSLPMTTANRLWDISLDGTYIDSTFVLTSYAPAPEMGIFAGGAYQFTTMLGVLPNVAKFGLAWASNDVAGCVNGAAPFTDTSVIISNRARLALGSYGGTSLFMNGWIKRWTYYNTRKSNAELQSLTAP